MIDNSKKIKNRWLIALSAVGIHASIGSVYAFSVFNKPLENIFSCSKNQIALTFSLAIVFLGLSAAVMGRFVEKKGPSVSGLISAVFWGGGLLGAAVAVYYSKLPLLWLTYGCLGGIGLGIGYITPVSTLVKWFPDRRGFATGLAIMGFGFGALAGAPVFNYLIAAFGVPFTFAVTGLFYILIMTSSALYLERPPEGFMPESMRVQIKKGEKKIKKDISQLTANEAVRRMPFWGLWLMMFINISCGIAVIYSASPLAQESLGLSAGEAAAIVGMMSLFNGLGRIGWATLSDWLGRSRTFMVFFIIQIIAFNILPSIQSIVAFQFFLYLILSCYGGGFATLPAFIGDLFGTKQLGAIHGYILTAWSAAGVAGPQLTAYIRTSTGSYSKTLYIFAALFTAAFVVSVLMTLYVNRAYKKQDN